MAGRKLKISSSTRSIHRKRNILGSHSTMNIQKLTKDFKGMNIKEVAGFYKNIHDNDGWSVKGYRVPSGNKYNQSQKALVGYKELNIKNDKTYIGEIV